MLPEETNTSQKKRNGTQKNVSCWIIEFNDPSYFIKNRKQETEGTQKKKHAEKQKKKVVKRRKFELNFLLETCGIKELGYAKTF